MLPCVIGVPVLLGILMTITNLLAVAHPDLGWAHTVANDAKALALGDGLYADPSHHYSGMLYGPVYPALLAPLYLIRWWDGWPPLVSTLAGLGLATMVGIVSAMPVREDEGQRRFARLGGVGLAGLVWWLVSANPVNFLYEGRSDQLAWCLALGGLCSLALTASRGDVRIGRAVALLVAATWTKQTAAGASVAAFAAMTAWMVMGGVPARVWRRFCAALVATNLGVLAALWVWSHGWVWHFLVTLPTRHGHDDAVAKYVLELRRLLTPLLLVLCALALALALALARARSSRIRGGAPDSGPSEALSFTLALSTLLVLFVVFSIPVTWLARLKQGGDANQYVGIMWAIGLLIAVAHRECRRRTWSMVVGTATYALLALPAAIPSAQSSLLTIDIAYPGTYPVVEQPALPPELVAYARTHEVYLPDRGLLTVARPEAEWPAQWNVIDLLAAGDTPDYLLDALVERRFDAVAHFDASWGAYASGTGIRPDYLALLNAVIDRGYIQGANGAPYSLLGRRAGSVDLGWLRECFAPEPSSDRCRSLLHSEDRRR